MTDTNHRITLAGRPVGNYMDRAHEAMLEMGGWLMKGKLIYKTDVVEGLDKAPAALNRLFTGANMGKVMVKL
jgi:NADPH-dependent curcumin reductase CurA